jgi:hypothetical protein
MAQQWKVYKGKEMEMHGRKKVGVEEVRLKDAHTARLSNFLLFRIKAFPLVLYNPLLCL